MLSSLLARNKVPQEEAPEAPSEPALRESDPTVQKQRPRSSGKARLEKHYQEARQALQEELMGLQQAIEGRSATLSLEKVSIREALDALMRITLAEEAIHLTTELLTSKDPDVVKQTLNALQQLHKRIGSWGRNANGWFELRYVNGHGPYLYHRYRGEDGKKYSDYYGRVLLSLEDHDKTAENGHPSIQGE